MGGAGGEVVTYDDGLRGRGAVGVDRSCIPTGRRTVKAPIVVYVKRQPNRSTGRAIYLVWREGTKIGHVCTGGFYSETVTDALCSVVNGRRNVEIRVVGGAK